MKALKLVAYNHLEYIEDAPVPEIGEDEVLVAVKAVGICGSDIHGIDGSTGRRIPPVIMGHEAAGDIVKVGSRAGGGSGSKSDDGAAAGYRAQSDDGAAALRPGMRVTFDSTLYCGECFYCRRGEINFCENRRVLGVSCDEYRQDGAFAEYVAVPARGVYPLPDDVSYRHAAMVEPLSIAVHAARITPHDVGDSAVVVGAGMIGLLLIQVLRASGYGRIIAVDLDDRRLELATSLGASAVVNPVRDDVSAVVARESAGRGVRNAFDVVGIQKSFDTAVTSVRRGGAVTIIGNFAAAVEMPLQLVVTRQITVKGSNASSGEYPACLELIRSGTVALDPLVSAEAPLAEGAEWFRRLYDNKEGLMKVILRPDA